MLSKTSLVLFLSIAYFFVGTWLYNEIVPGCQPEPEIEVPHTVVPSEPLMFNWASPNVITNSSFDDFKNKLMAGKTEDNIFEITGKYFKSESAPEGFADMGMARAEAVRKLFPNLPNERIRLKSMLAEDVESMQTIPFTNSSFQWIAAPKELASVVEIGNQTLIYFNANSAVGKIDPKVEEYLSGLAEILKTTEETVSITGHTDNIGPAEGNLKLGLQRAKAIQKILLRLGVSAEKIKVDSRGENEPISTNNTEAGRTSNRRTVIQRIK